MESYCGSDNHGVNLAVLMVAALTKQDTMMWCLHDTENNIVSTVLSNTRKIQRALAI